MVSIRPQDPPQQAIASLSARDCKVKPISGDGNCLLRALVFVLYSNEMWHEKVGELLVQFVFQNQDSFNHYLDGDFEIYLSNMRFTRVWSTAVEILATVSLLQIPVFTPNFQHEYLQISWFRYIPLHGDMLSHPKNHHLNSCLL